MLTEHIDIEITIYKQFMTQQQNEDRVRVFELKNQPSMLGTKDLISWIKDHFFKGIENEPRDVAIYLIRAMRAEPLIRIGVRFGLNRYSSVSSVVMLAKEKLQKNRKFKARLSDIEIYIFKGQT